MVKKSKKHQILGEIKVSSQQLSKWGKLGGRPKKYASVAEKSRAQRLRKKQEKLGKGFELRAYRSYEEKISQATSFVRLICANCGNKIIGGAQHLNQQCSRCYQGQMCEDIIIRKRAGSSKERGERFRGKRRKVKEFSNIQ